MEELIAENEKLKKENARLTRLANDLLSENKYLKAKTREENRTRVKYINFKKRPKPTLYLDHKEIVFKSSNSNTARLLKALFEIMPVEDGHSRITVIERMQEEPVSIEILHDLIYGEDTENDWFSLSQDGREKAKGNMRQLFRQINSEVKPVLGGADLFIPDNNGFKINKNILI